MSETVKVICRGVDIEDVIKSLEGMAKEMKLLTAPKRKPLTSNERLQGFIELRDKDDGVHLLSFLAGICFAEKHYRIGDEDG